MELFYCTSCGFEDRNYKMSTEEEIKRKNIVNIRSGYGRMFLHLDCPQCEYELATLVKQVCNEVDINELKCTIELYTKPHTEGYWSNEDREAIIRKIKIRKGRTANV